MGQSVQERFAEKRKAADVARRYNIAATLRQYADMVEKGDAIPGDSEAAEWTAKTFDQALKAITGAETYYFSPQDAETFEVCTGGGETVIYTNGAEAWFPAGRVIIHPYKAEEA